MAQILESSAKVGDPIYKFIDNKFIGGIAQLVEHCFCTAGVSGSNPLTSKKKRTCFQVFFLKMLKKLRACEGSLGIQKRRRTWLPAKRFGELEAGFDPEVSE